MAIMNDSRWLKYLINEHKDFYNALGRQRSICLQQGIRIDVQGRYETPKQKYKVAILCNKYGYSVDECLNILNKKSGVLALSENLSSDFRDLEDGAKNGNEACALAREKFCYEVAKYVGAYAAALKGIDVLTFTAGVGENDADTRAAICEYLGFLGVKLDPELNAQRGEHMISAADSKVQVWIVPTNEELMIAQDTADLVNAAK